MSKRLNKREKGFALDYIDTGNATLAAKNNYGVSTDNSAAVQGHRLLRKSKIQEYIEDKAEKAASVVAELMETSDNESIRLNASKDILDRGGFKAIDKHINLNLDGSPTERSTELGNRLLGLLRH